MLWIITRDSPKYLYSTQISNQKSGEIAFSRKIQTAPRGFLQGLASNTASTATDTIYINFSNTQERPDGGKASNSATLCVSDE
jgi:hypothetical protein